MGFKSYETDLHEAVRSDVADVQELILRQIVVGLTAAMIWVLLRDPLVVIWAIGYPLLNTIYVLVLRAADRRKSRRTYVASLACYALVSTWYALMPLYLLTFDSAVVQFIGACGLIGMALHVMAYHAELTHIGLWDMGMILGSLLATSVIYFMRADTMAEHVAVIVATLATGAYYLQSYLGLRQARRDLQIAREAEAQSQKMRAVGQLTAGIAHDFNNILTVIRGNLDLVSEMRDPAEREAVLAEACASSNRAAHLVRQLLAYSRKSQLREEAVALVPFLRGFADSVDRVLPATVRLLLREPLEDVSAKVDRNLLNSALLNATINARDALLPGGGEVVLGLSAEADVVRISVADNGPGMSDEALQRATEPFYTTKPVGEGSGLGLSMAKGFAEQSGGMLTLENRRSGGLRLTISLPRSNG